ncbi:MAG: (2Fe-2S)-binding protein [Planctomycetes bacterium]|nr:(2Fe-2S)-binding protein [Planctomycetota bacterium]
MPKLTFVRSNQTFDVPVGTRFLEFCDDHPGLHDFGCQVGSCGTCVLTLVAGADQVNPLTTDESDTLEMCTEVKGARLGCQLEIRGDCAVKPL